MAPWLQALYLEIPDVWPLWEILATVLKAKLKVNVFQILEELVGLGLQDGDTVDTCALQIDQKVNDYNIYSK